ncbi:flagellar basal-body MS-ring/collar protein FliF [Actinophytocola xanthii]|uniref:Flagellar M-ring protein n=1 Tax=Actinophytocola xanthii TaxID=1912961 RepID=A0A1Q8CYD2_9PSEU|nr:flagellar basal-body MS-ring/collar protein FliF [Actinophytocola xanthii]OLF19360.1 flagellar M-ring protein FliF [Actinophytocola xanthii]
MNQERLLASARRVGDKVRALSFSQRMIGLVSVVAIVIGVWVFASWLSKPTYSPLFSNLAAKDASAIVDQLDASGVPYELTDGGQTVQVPKDQIYSLRLKMSAAGLPAQEDTGYSLLDQQGVTTSEFMQQVGYQRALEGELSKTIESIDGVNAATVHLVIPEKDVFSDDASKPTAAIMIAESPGKPVSADTVQAVVHLTASSVEGLATDDITVADSNGKVLAAPGQAVTGSGGGGSDQATTDYEDRLSGSLQEMLTQVVGPNHAVVQVTADLDFDKTETKSQTYTSDEDTAPLSESTTDEKYTGTGAGGNNNAGGVLGQTNGTTAGVTGGANGGNGTYQQTKEVRDNAVNSVIETRQSAPGKVRKLGVAVLLDSATAAKVDMAQVRQLASSAVGLDTTRGDTLAVSAMPFDQSAAETAKEELAAAQAEAEQAEMISLIKTAAGALGGILLLLFLLLVLRRRRKRALAAQSEERTLEAIKAQLERAKLDMIENDATKELSAPDTKGQLGPGAGYGPSDEQQRKLEEIEALVDEQPDEVAQLLRGWLATKESV